MIKELIFSDKKFYEGQVPNYIGKTVHGVKNEIQRYDLTYDRAQTSDYRNTFKPSELNGFKVVNQLFNGAHDTNDNYDKTFVTVFSGSFDSLKYSVKVDDIFANGGVSSSPLTHLYQGLRHLLNRKVALAND